MNSVYGAANAFLLVYVGLFPIINPIGGAPIFLGLTRHCTDAERNSLAFQVARNSLFLLIGSLLIGSYVLEFFGITLPIMRVAGGLVVTATGWTLLQEGDGDDDRTAHKPVIPTDAFYPLTMPITVGPGSIAVAITLGTQRPSGNLTTPAGALTQLAILGGAAVGGVIAIAATIYLCYRFAEGTVGALGVSGTNVLVRLSAFILFCIGIQIVWDGYSALAHVAGAG
jgi:multiple antibiotic resistance protein